MWDVKIEDWRIEVKTRADEISAIRGTVTFHPGDVVGERCGNEISITADMLGNRGHQILSLIRPSAPGATVMISPHQLVIHCTDAEQVEAALAVIDELDPVKIVIGEAEWLGDRMIRIDIPLDTPLTAAGLKFEFDGEPDSVPVQVHHSEVRRKLQDSDLTRMGRKILDELVELTERFGVALFALSHNCLEVCFRAPCEECNREQRAAELVAAIA